MEHLVAVELAVIPKDGDIGILKASCFIQGVKYPAKLFIYKSKGMIQLFASYPQFVALMIHIG